MVASSRLDWFDRELASALTSASAELQRQAAETAASWAIARTGLVHPALFANSVESVSDLCAELNEQYFAMSEEREVGRASDDDVVAAFGRARAANAVEFMLRGEPGEAIYESAAATENWPELKASLLLLLRAAKSD